MYAAIVQASLDTKVKRTFASVVARVGVRIGSFCGC